MYSIPTSSYLIISRDQYNTMIADAVTEALNRTTPTNEGYLSVDEAAALTGLKPQTIRLRASRNTIPVSRAGSRLRFLESELRDWMKSR